jgi:hypothetical protein
MQVVRRGFLAFALAGGIGVTTPLAAQGRYNAGRGVPPGHMPPAGMCRIWIDGVPPGRQSPPTDCATARRYVPRYGRVIYGPEVRYVVVKEKHHKKHDRWDDRDRWDTRRERVIIIPEPRRRVEGTTVCISHDRTGVCVSQRR